MNKTNLVKTTAYTIVLAIAIGSCQEKLRIGNREFDIDAKNFSPKWSELPEDFRAEFITTEKEYMYEGESDEITLIAIAAHYAKSAYNWARGECPTIIDWKDTEDWYRKITLDLARMSFDSTEEEMNESIEDREKPWKDLSDQERMIMTIFKNAAIEACMALTGERRLPDSAPTGE